MLECLVIIPAYNEEHNIIRVLQDIYSLRMPVDVMVIDDGSTDKTADAVKAANANVISLPFNLGYGNALQTGYKYALAKGYKYVMQLDADGQHDPGNLPAMLDLLKSGRADIVIGSRFLGQGSYDPGFMKRLAIHIFRFIIKAATGVKITDPSSGLRGLNRRTFQYFAGMGNFPPDYPDADVLIQMLRHKYRILEFPANMRERIHGVSMHAGMRPVYYVIKLSVSILVVLLRPNESQEE